MGCISLSRQNRVPGAEHRWEYGRDSDNLITGQRKKQTADCRLQIEGKMRTAVLRFTLTDLITSQSKDISLELKETLLLGLVLNVLISETLLSESWSAKSEAHL